MNFKRNFIDNRVCFSPENNDIKSNIPEFSVSEISGGIKKLLETTFGHVRIRGEITELRSYSSGHIYLSLKDQGGKISGVIWRSAVARLNINPEDGKEVIVTGKVSSYGERSSYQIIISQIEYAGEGALLAQIEKLKKKLKAEGLFDQNKKKKIPIMPYKIGVITSKEGAVLHDICTTIERRFPTEILLWPVPVQGRGAEIKIANAIKGMNELSHPPDLIIVARGGGSTEDLMPFNDEIVVREAARSVIPLISAVGHETDTTLIDYVADKRAPTPTAAAEMSVPVRDDLFMTVMTLKDRLYNALSNIIRDKTNHLRTEKLIDIEASLNGMQQRLDDRISRLERSLPQILLQKSSLLKEGKYFLPPFEYMISVSKTLLIENRNALKVAWRELIQGKRLDLLNMRLSSEDIKSRLSLSHANLKGIEKCLEAISPQAVLERGYVFVCNYEDKPVTKSAQLPKNSSVILHFSDGLRDAHLDSSGPFPLPRKKRPKETEIKFIKKQGDLGI